MTSKMQDFKANCISELVPNALVRIKKRVMIYVHALARIITEPGHQGETMVQNRKVNTHQGNTHPALGEDN